ncbi:MAG: acyl-CoA dehydrogenase family protein [SAR324 cluster bacterium]|nr:acyl-CoA dehydrogenase family protein [SAR324 cluster bacterium]
MKQFQVTQQLFSTRQNQQKGRNHMKEWQTALKKNIYSRNTEFKHSIEFYFGENAKIIQQRMEAFGKIVVDELEPLVDENDFRLNLPRLEAFNGIGEYINQVIHHPTYVAAGDIIYGTEMMRKAADPSTFMESLCLFFLSSHAGEAGHNCPVACTAGIIRVLGKSERNAEAEFYLQKLMEPSFKNNFTGAQFVTEVQGGSDVALNDCRAVQDSDGTWRIYGEKWFCSNANADLILITARYDESNEGTKGLGLFLIPALLNDGEKNQYRIRRLKEKLGTRTMASGEIDFDGAIARPVGEVTQGFKMLMQNVLHLSRIYNSMAALGAARRAIQIAYDYAEHRRAFGHAILNYPLVQENLVKLHVENIAAMSSTLATIDLQAKYDAGQICGDSVSLLLRLLANLNKYITALWGVEHIHHSIDVLAGNGAIESFSSLPRLLRDSIVIENWEGTHNTLKMQILRDLHKYRIDEIFMRHVENELSEIHSDPPAKTEILNQLNKTREMIQNMKQSTEILQTLQIHQVTEQMILIFCALSLLKEGMHQQQQQISSKLNALEYLILIHFGNRKPDLNQAYLDLIQKIIRNF